MPDNQDSVNRRDFMVKTAVVSRRARGRQGTVRQTGQSGRYRTGDRRQRSHQCRRHRRRRTRLVSGGPICHHWRIAPTPAKSWRWPTSTKSASGGRRKAQMRRLSGLPRDHQPLGYRRGGGGHAGSLACAHRARSHGPWQGCLPRKAHVPHHRGGAASLADGERDQAGIAGRFADHFGVAMARRQEVHRRWRHRQDDHEPGFLSPQLQRRRMELGHRRRRRAGRQERELHRLEDVAGQSAQAALRCRPFLPLPQVLGLFGRHRDRPVLPRGGAVEHLLVGTAIPQQGIGERRHLCIQRTSAKCPILST